MMTKPPLFVGAAKLTVTLAFPANALMPVGAPGTIAGVTLFDEAEAALVPALFVAVTAKVYAVPLARPLSVIAEPEPVATNPPGLDVTV
jgi:hypothetical protein